MKKFTVEVTSRVTVVLDETKFTDEFLEEFNGSISDWGDDLEKHAEHLAWIAATGVEDISPSPWLKDPSKSTFVEGYGPVAELGIHATIDDVSTEILEVEDV